MNPFDLNISLWFNHLSRIHLIESLIVIIQNNDLIKDAPIVAAFWWAWHETGLRTRSVNMRDLNRRSNQERLLSVITISILALLFARILALILPFRIRPLNADLMGFHDLALGENAFVRWSAFPSDNAVLFSSLVTGTWIVSKRLGIFAAFYFLIFVCLPRLVAGIHWPTDLIGGCLIGVGMAHVAMMPKIQKVLGNTGLRWLEKWPGPGYALLFLLTFQMTRLFDESLDIVAVLIDTIKHRL